MALSLENNSKNSCKYTHAHSFSAAVVESDKNGKKIIN
jgi:hypothetical protein